MEEENKVTEKSKGFEIASCIIAIIVGALFIVMTVTSLLSLNSEDFYIVLNELYDEFDAMEMGISYEQLETLFRSVMIMMSVVSAIAGAALIVMASIVLKGVKNEDSRRKLRKAYVIVVGVATFGTLFGLGLNLLSIFIIGGGVAAFILENVFLNRNKKPKIFYYYVPTQPTPPVDPFTGTPTNAANGNPDIFTEDVATPIVNAQADIFGAGVVGNNAQSAESLDSKLADLKKLRDSGVLTDEQYAQAVEKLIKDESQR